MAQLTIADVIIGYMKTNLKNFLIMVSVVVVGTVPTQAALLGAGSTITMSLEAESVCATIVTTASVPFASPNFAGTLVSTVWSHDVSNPFGGLTFTYQVFNDGLDGQGSSTSHQFNHGSDTLDRLTFSSYLGFLTDVNCSGVGIVPFNAVRNGSGSQISFNFRDPPEQSTLTPGHRSPLLIIQTDSAFWQNSIAMVVNANTVNVATFAPAAVPEPASATLALVCIAACWVGRRLKP